VKRDTAAPLDAAARSPPGSPPKDMAARAVRVMETELTVIATYVKARVTATPNKYMKATRTPSVPLNCESAEKTMMRMSATVPA